MRAGGVVVDRVHVQAVGKGERDGDTGVGFSRWDCVGERFRRDIGR